MKERDMIIFLSLAMIGAYILIAVIISTQLGSGHWQDYNCTNINDTYNLTINSGSIFDYQEVKQFCNVKGYSLGYYAGSSDWSVIHCFDVEPKRESDFRLSEYINSIKPEYQVCTQQIWVRDKP